MFQALYKDKIRLQSIAINRKYVIFAPYPLTGESEIVIGPLLKD
jgi:hypothetical protein